MVGFVEILVLRVVVEETMEERKGDKEKKVLEGGDEVEVERKMEEAGEEVELGDQGDDSDPGVDVDLDPGWTFCSR